MLDQPPSQPELVQQGRGRQAQQGPGLGRQGQVGPPSHAAREEDEAVESGEGSGKEDEDYEDRRWRRIVLLPFGDSWVQRVRQLAVAVAVTVAADSSLPSLPPSAAAAEVASPVFLVVM